MSVTNTLKERGARYGKFSGNAKKTAALRDLLLDDIDDPVIYEGLVYISQKLARIASGDALYIDNYRDIAGYAQLIVDYLEKEADEATDAKVCLKKKVHGEWELV